MEEVAVPDTDTQPQQQPQPAQGQNVYRTLQDMEQRLRSITTELRTLDELQEPTEEDVNWQGTLIAEYDDLDKKATPLRKRMADIRRITQARENPDNREDGVPKTNGGRQAPEMFVKNHQDPLENLDAVRAKLVASGELRSRAETLIERDNKRYELTHDYAETATRRAVANPRVAAHILLTGSQEYRDAFRAYLEDPDVGVQRLRSLTLGTASAGFMLPYVLDPTIVLTNAGSANPFRRVARMETTTSNAWQGVNSAGVNAAWVAEGATAADASPTIGQIQITPLKGAAWVFGSYESLDDTNFGEQLPGLLADARDRLESNAFAVGTGTTQPLGFIPGAYGTANATTGTATGTALAPFVYTVQAALPPRFRNSPQAGWMASLPWINTLRALDQSGGSSFWANFGAGTPEQLLGQNIYEASDMRSTTTSVSGSGGVALGYADWKQFIIVDRVGVSMLYEPMVKASGNATLPTGNAGWYMFWRTGSGIAATAAFRFLVFGTAA
jgi:HK97 family phage major capsid protein